MSRFNKKYSHRTSSSDNYIIVLYSDGWQRPLHLLIIDDYCVIMSCPLVPSSWSEALLPDNYRVTTRCEASHWCPYDLMWCTDELVQVVQYFITMKWLRNCWLYFQWYSGSQACCPLMHGWWFNYWPLCYSGQVPLSKKPQLPVTARQAPWMAAPQPRIKTKQTGGQIKINK